MDRLSSLPRVHQWVGPHETICSRQWSPLLTNSLHFAWKRHLQSNSCTSHPQSFFVCGASSPAQVSLPAGNSTVGQREGSCSFCTRWCRALSSPSSQSGATHPLQCNPLTGHWPSLGTGPHRVFWAQLQVFPPANKMWLDIRKKISKAIKQKDVTGNSWDAGQCRMRKVHWVNTSFIFSPLSTFWIGGTQHNCSCAFTQVLDSSSWTAHPSWERGQRKARVLPRAVADIQN